MPQSFDVRASNADEAQSRPLQLVYGCPPPVSRKFRIVNEKCRTAASEELFQASENGAGEVAGRELMKLLAAYLGDSVKVPP
jgi:hypothetical protein